MTIGDRQRLEHRSEAIGDLVDELAQMINDLVAAELSACPI